MHSNSGAILRGPRQARSPHAVSNYEQGWIYFLGTLRDTLSAR